MEEGFPNSKYLLIFQAKIEIKMFHKKYHQNRIINEDFNILDLGREGGKTPISENFQFRLNYKLTIK